MKAKLVVNKNIGNEVSSINNKKVILSINSAAYKYCQNMNEINNQNENGYTPVYCSILDENIQALNELLILGANPNIPNILGETPLYLSVDKSNLDALIILLQYNADCNIITKRGNTPLHLAIQKNEENIIQILLRNNADPNIKNNLYGQTATHLAIINKYDDDILNLFKENKADIFQVNDKFNKTPFDYAKESKDENYINLILKIFGNNNNNSNNNYIEKQLQTWNKKKTSKNKPNEYRYLNEDKIINNTDRSKYKNKLNDNYYNENNIKNSNDKSKNTNQNKANDFNISYNLYSNKYSISTETNKNEFKLDENTSSNPTNKSKVKEKTTSDKNIYTHGRAIISSDLHSNNIQIKELNNSSERTFKSKKSSTEFLAEDINDINNIDIISYKQNDDDASENKENININNKKFRDSEKSNSNSNNSNISNNNASNNIGFSLSSNKNNSPKNNNLYESNSLCANRKIIKSIINDTVKKIVIKTISSNEDDNSTSNINLLSKDSEHNYNMNSNTEDIKKDLNEQIQINEQININNNNNEKNTKHKIELNTNNFEDNTVNLYENGTTSFLLYNNKNSNEQNNTNSIMLNNIVNNNLNENKSINISNIYDEVNLNTNSSNMNKANANEYIADNNINRNKTINLNNINLDMNQNNNNTHNTNNNMVNFNINSINLNNNDKDNMFLTSTHSHIFSDLQGNTNTNNYNLTNNNIELSYSRNQQSEEEENNNSNLFKNSEINTFKEYKDKSQSNIFTESNSHIDINIVDPNKNDLDNDNDNYDNRKTNKSIYNNNLYKNSNSITSNNMHGSNGTIKINTDNFHQKKKSNGKVSKILNNQSQSKKEINSSVSIKKSKSFVDSTQKKSNFNRSLYSPSEIKRLNQNNPEQKNTTKNNQIYKKHHRQLSYHLNYKSGLNNKEKEPENYNLNIINYNYEENKENFNENTNNPINRSSTSNNEIIYYNKNNITNSLYKSNKSKKINSNQENKSKNKINSQSKKYISSNNYNPVDSINKEPSIYPTNKTIASTINQNQNNTVTHQIKELKSNYKFNKKDKFASIVNTINNTTLSTINRQKNSPSNRQSKNNNIKHIPINQNRNGINHNCSKFHTHNYNNYNDEINGLEEEDDEDYFDSDKLKNIPTNILLRLRDWLISCDLLCYYNLFISKNMYDIDSYIKALQEGSISISYRDIEKLGIKKPGHIYRLLIRLELDAGLIDINLFNYILEKISYNTYSTTLALTSSINDINCCGINVCPNECKNNKYGNSRKQKYVDVIYNDLSSFLRGYNLYKFKGNFIYNGFDKIEYVIIQLFSKYSFNKRILNDHLHVYIEKDKSKLLNRLYLAKASISRECGIEIDEEEMNKITNFSHKKNKNNRYNNYYNSNSQKRSYSNYYFSGSSIQRSSSCYNNSNNNTINNDNNNICQIF